MDQDFRNRTEQEYVEAMKGDSSSEDFGPSFHREALYTHFVPDQEIVDIVEGIDAGFKRFGKDERYKSLPKKVIACILLLPTNEQEAILNRYIIESGQRSEEEWFRVLDDIVISHAEASNDPNSILDTYVANIARYVGLSRSPATYTQISKDEFHKDPRGLIDRYLAAYEIDVSISAGSLEAPCEDIS